MRRLAIAAIALFLFGFPAGAQDITQVPARSGVLVTLTPNGVVSLLAGDVIELENGVRLQRDSEGRFQIIGTFVRLTELAANPFTFNGQRVTVTDGFLANVLPQFGFFQYSNLVAGATITVLTEGVDEAALGPYTEACAGFVTDSNALCARSVLGTVNVNEDGTVELSDPVIVTP